MVLACGDPSSRYFCGSYLSHDRLDEKHMSWIEEAKKRCDAAYPEPWENRCNNFCSSAKPRYIWSEYGWLGEFMGSSGDINAEFAANARTDLPRALELIEKMEAALNYIACMGKDDADFYGAEADNNYMKLLSQFQSLESAYQSLLKTNSEISSNVGGVIFFPGVQQFISASDIEAVKKALIEKDLKSS